MTARLPTIVLALCWGAPSVCLGAETPLTPAEAIKRVGQTVYVEMKFRNSKDRIEAHGLVYLDSEDDFHNPNNLGVAITSAAAAKLKQKGIADPAAFYLGKTIRIRGEILIFEKLPYLPVADADAIEVVGVKK